MADNDSRRTHPDGSLSRLIARICGALFFASLCFVAGYLVGFIDGEDKVLDALAKQGLTVKEEIFNYGR